MTKTVSFHRRGLLALPAVIGTAQAQGSGVRIIVPYPPGGGIDVAARIFAEPLTTTLGTPWLVENRSGANGSVGSAAVARAEADGRTILCNSDSHLLARAVMRQVPYDPLTDFTPIVRLGLSPLVLVSGAQVAARDMTALLADIRANPNNHAFANTSLGTSGHLATETFRVEIGVPVLIVSYRGTGPALTDVVAGQTSLMMAPLVNALPLLRGGQLRAYFVTGPGRTPVAPEIPAAAEVGMAAVGPIAPWFGFWGPKGLPAENVERINAAVQRAAATAEVQRKLADLGGQPILGESAAQFSAFIQEAATRGRGVLARAGVQPE